MFKITCADQPDVAVDHQHSFDGSLSLQ